MIFYKLMPTDNLAVSLLVSPVTAGMPAGIEQEWESINLDKWLFSEPSEGLVIKVVGDSMEDVPIRPGDWITVDPSVSPKPNDIVVAFIGGGYIVKRFKLNDARGNQGLYLVSENPKYLPINVKECNCDGECEIVGVVTSVIQKLRP